MRARFAVMGVVAVGVLAALSGATVFQLDRGDAGEAQYEIQAAGLPASDFVVDMSGGFPQNLTVVAGESVLFVNGTSEVHTVTKRRGKNAGPGPFFNSGPLATGQFYLRAFNVPGEIRYFSKTDKGEPDARDYSGKITVLSAD